MYTIVKRAAATLVPILAALCLCACALVAAPGGNGAHGGNGYGADRIPVYDVVTETMTAQAKACDEPARLAWYKRVIAASDDDAAVHEVIPADCEPR
jgi:hypothetical protein